MAGFVAVAGIALVSYARGAGEGDMGATTEIAALGTFALGAVAGVGQLVVAGAAGVTVAVLLAVKPSLERLSRALSEPEISAVLELAVISAIVLPLVPDHGYGPWGVLNPFRIWMVVVLVSAVSFAGFIAVRWRGEHGGPVLGGRPGRARLQHRGHHGDGPALARVARGRAGHRRGRRAGDQRDVWPPARAGGGGRAVAAVPGGAAGGGHGADRRALGAAAPAAAPRAPRARPPAS